MQVIDTLNPELSEQNVFEQLFSLLERQAYDLTYSNAGVDLERLHDIVERLDNAFSELNIQENNAENIGLYNMILNETMLIFIRIFNKDGFRDDPFFHAFERFLLFFLLIIMEGSYVRNQKDLLSSFYDNFKSLQSVSFDVLKRLNDKDYISSPNDPDEYIVGFQIAEFYRAFPLDIGIQTEGGTLIEGPIEVYLNDSIQKTIEWDEDVENWKTLQTDYYFNMKVEITAPKYKSDKLIDTLWHITTALGNVDGLRIELKDIHRGSLIAKLKVLAKEPEVIEEAKAILQTGIETATKVLSGGTASYTEVKNSRLENQKTKLEIERLDKEIKQMPSDDEIKQIRSLELKSQLLDVEKKQIENASAKLDLLSKLSDLAAKGILEADMIRIEVDDVLRLLKSGDEIKEIGPDITGT